MWPCRAPLTLGGFVKSFLVSPARGEPREGTVWGVDDNQASLSGWCKMQWFSLPLTQSKGKRWRCWLCLPASTAGLPACAWGDLRTGKHREKSGCWDPQQGYETTARTGMFSLWAGLIRQCVVETANQWQGQTPSLSCLLPENPISLSNPIPYQDGSIKRKSTEGLGLFKYGYEFLKVLQIQKTKSYFLFPRSGTEGGIPLEH